MEKASTNEDSLSGRQVAIILSAILILVIALGLSITWRSNVHYRDYIVTDKYFSPKQYTKIRKPGAKGGYYDVNTYIPDTYIIVYRQLYIKHTRDTYKSFPKSFYDKVSIGDTICFNWGEIHPCSSHQLKINKQLRK
jgi:hypothetical protein